MKPIQYRGKSRLIRTDHATSTENTEPLPRASSSQGHHPDVVGGVVGETNGLETAAHIIILTRETWEEAIEISQSQGIF